VRAAATSATSFAALASNGLCSARARQPHPPQRVSHNLRSTRQQQSLQRSRLPATIFAKLVSHNLRSARLVSPALTVLVHQLF